MSNAVSDTVGNLEPKHVHVNGACCEMKKGDEGVLLLRQRMILIVVMIVVVNEMKVFGMISRENEDRNEANRFDRENEEVEKENENEEL